MSGLSVAEVLDRAADLIEPAGRWTQGALAKTADGTLTDSKGPNAVCWCMEGAIGAICSGVPKHELYQMVRHIVGETFLHHWNDADARTQGEVVAALRAAAARARDQGK